MAKFMTFEEAMHIVCPNWSNPIHPYFCSGVNRTAYEAYKELDGHDKAIVKRLIGHDPKKDEQ